MVRGGNRGYQQRMNEVQYRWTIYFQLKQFRVQNVKHMENKNKEFNR